MTPEFVAYVLNTLAIFMLVALLGAGLFGLIRRLNLYRTARRQIPVLLRRDTVFLSALAIISLEALGLRAAGVTMLEGWIRVGYILQQDVILILAFIYWVKVELFDVDDPDKP